MASRGVRQIHRVFLGPFVILALASTACGSADQTETTITAPTSATTVLVDTSEPQLTSAPETTFVGVDIIEVTFDGSACTATGPDKVSAGVHSFVLLDLTGEGLADLRTMAIQDGHTYQDLLDLQSEPGEYIPIPPWAEWPLSTFERVDRDLAENELGKKLILEPGEHWIVVGTGKGDWFCGALRVSDPSL